MKRGFNDYRVVDGVVYLALTNRAGDVIAETMVDETDLPLLKGMGVRWAYGQINRWKKYVMAKAEGRTVYLHRLIMGYPPHHTDHLDGNTLNNRRGNLRAATVCENMQNRPANRNTATGHRNVYYLKDGRRRPFRVRLNSKEGAIYSTYFRTLNIAVITAEMARLQYWGKEAV